MAEEASPPHDRGGNMMRRGIKRKRAHGFDLPQALLRFNGRHDWS
jgi:hypothetical protein